MPLTGSVQDRIRELYHHGTKKRSRDEIIAIAYASKRRDEGKKKMSLRSFMEECFKRKSTGKPSREQTEPLKTKGITQPITLDRQSLLDGLAKAAERVHPSPSDAQRKAGNYRMGHVTLHGMDITIESPVGSTRRGKGKDGTPWEVQMKNHYGYIKRTESEADRDHVDVFVGPNPESELVFVIDQHLGGNFDEHKCMLGFTNEEEAKKAYHDNYSESWEGFGNIRSLTVPQFKKWVKKGHTHIPIARQVLVFNAEPIKLAAETDLADRGSKPTVGPGGVRLGGIGLLRRKLKYTGYPPSTGGPGLPSRGYEYVTDHGFPAPHTHTPTPESSPSPEPSSSSSSHGIETPDPYISGGSMGMVAEDARSVRTDSAGDFVSHSEYPGFQRTARHDFIDPDSLFAAYYGEPIETFAASDPHTVYRAPGYRTHYNILESERYRQGDPEMPASRPDAVRQDWVLGRTGNVYGHRVTSFWNNSYQEDAVKAYVLQQIKEGRLHPENDLIAFRGNSGLMRAGDFVGHTSTEEEKAARQWTPEELARAHIDPALKREILGSAARKFKSDPMRDALIKAGLLVPGQNWRRPLEAQRPGAPQHFDRPLPGWVPREDPAKPADTGWVPVQSSWIAGLKMTPDRTVEMTTKKGGKTYPYPGLSLDMFKRWIKAQSPGKWWWRNIGRPMRMSVFTGKIHPLFTPAVDRPFRMFPFTDDFGEKSSYTYPQIMDWARRHIHPQITDTHLAALVGALPGTHTLVMPEGPLGYGYQLAGHEPTNLTFSTGAPGYNVMRTIHSKNVSPTNQPHIHNEHMIVDKFLKERAPHGGTVITDNPYRGVSGPALLRQMRAAFEMNIPRITWQASWTPEHQRTGSPMTDFEGGLHWPLLGANGYVPAHVPEEIEREADQASGGRFKQTRLFSDFFQSPVARQWYSRNPASHSAFVETTPGSYSRVNVERHVGEAAARHGMEGPIPDAHMHQQPLPRNAAEAKMAEPEPEPARMHMIRQWHPAVEHLIATNSLHPDHLDEYFNK